MLVEEIGALRDFVLDNLYMGSQNALFGMGFWMCSIVDIRIGAALGLVDGLVDGQTRMDSAWVMHGSALIQPQRTALADRRGQRHPSPNRCWVGKSSEKTPA